MIRLLSLSLLAAGLPALVGAAAPRAQAELACESTGAVRSCTACSAGPCRRRAAHDARVRLGASMPSMPMAHSVRPVAALPAGEPGSYRATLALEMTGVWAVEIDIAAPHRDRLVRTLRVECQNEQRCAAAPATAGRAPHRH